MKVLRIVLLMLTGILALSINASDSKREFIFADEIRRSLSFGEIVMLLADGEEFLALYAQTEKIINNGTVILLHDMGGQPDQSKLIHSLRTRLPGHNWATLSLQMPLREDGARQQDYFPLFADAVSRIQTGIDFLVKKDINNIILAGYGLGALMALYFQSEMTSEQVKAIVAINLPFPETDSGVAQTLKFIKKIEQPFLDIYGGHDGLYQKNNVRERRLAAKENSSYRRINIDTQAYRVDQQDDLIVKRVHSWLSRELNH